VHVLGFGHTGLAVSTSLVALGNFALLAFVLRRRIGRYGLGLPVMLGRILVATALMSAAAAGADRFLCSLGQPPYYARVGVILLVALPVFATACRWLAVPLPRLPWRR
jgi:peptidoglycan biosynthesis protein MviN/MurJ (putative lipid II flippase)